MNFMKIACLVLLASTLVLADDEEYDFNIEKKKHVSIDALLSYNKWKFSNKRAYLSDEEETFRQLVFFDNFNKIQQHNAKNLTYQLGINQFSDMTQEEFESRMLNKYIMEHPIQRNETEEEEEVEEGENVEEVDAKNDKRKLATLPLSVDWRAKGAVTAVKNQGSCGSCWAFSTTGLLEGVNVLRNKPLTSFSEQQLVDCCTKANGFQCSGCYGAFPSSAIDYVKKYGVLTQSAYPYIGSQSTCKVTSPTAGFYVSSYSYVLKSVNYLKAAVSVQPVSVVVHATYWSGYSSGVFSNCRSESGYGNHAVLLVGYSNNGEWIVKNSWGPSWGQSGYITLAPGNTCGIYNTAVIARI